MSVEKNYYVIVGYDLTKYVTPKYEDWRWTPEGEEYTNQHTKGNIQIFDDPMYSGYLYLGYILAAGDEYYFETSRMSPLMLLFSDIKSAVDEQMHELIELGILDLKGKSVDYQMIVFEECT